MHEHRHAAEQAQGLGGARAEPLPAPGGRDDGGRRGLTERLPHGAATGLGEHQAAVGGGEDAGDADVDLLADAVAGVLGDDHRAVVEVADRLAVLLARLEQVQVDLVAGDDRRPQREREGVQVHHLDAGEGGRLGEVGVEGEQRAVAVDGRAGSAWRRPRGRPGPRRRRTAISTPGSRRSASRTSSPRRPLARRRSSPASARPCSSSSTGCGTRKRPCRKPARTTSSTRPSMATEVSTRRGSDAGGTAARREAGARRRRHRAPRRGASGRAGSRAGRARARGTGRRDDDQRRPDAGTAASESGRGEDAPTTAPKPPAMTCSAERPSSARSPRSSGGIVPGARGRRRAT